ncbi:hypothetical protein CU098_010663, partial [Rhizopus stolonifer]
GLTSFGTNPLQPGIQQQPMIASVDKNPYGNNPLFDLSKVSNTTGAKTGPSAVPVDGSQRKPQGPHYPISPRVVSKIKLRGFSYHPGNNYAAKKNAPAGSLDGISDDAVLGAGAFAPRPSSKKLVFDDNVDTANIVALVNKKSDKRKNGYYISPSLELLSSMPKEGLKQVQNLVVGRKGFGEIRFEQSVDLSDIDLEEIMGHLVVIEEKTAVIYPDQDSKPPKGTGLNVPAIVTLENCFTRDKNTSAPIKDPEHPRFKLFKERLVKRSGVDFVDYDDATGKWTFRAHEF